MHCSGLRVLLRLSPATLHVNVGWVQALEDRQQNSALPKDFKNTTIKKKRKEHKNVLSSNAALASP